VTRANKQRGEVDRGGVRTIRRGYGLRTSLWSTITQRHSTVTVAMSIVIYVVLNSNGGGKGASGGSTRTALLIAGEVTEPIVLVAYCRVLRR